MAAKQGEPSDSPDQFADAWGSVEGARAARSALAECWRELCDAESFSCYITVDSDGINGQFDVTVEWPEPLRERANEAASALTENLVNAFDSAILAAAKCTSGSVQEPDRELHKMPFCVNGAEFQEFRSRGGFNGLRPDQIRQVELFQPYPPNKEEAGTIVEEMRRVVGHLAATSDANRAHLNRVSVWAHSAAPSLEVTHPLSIDSLDITEDGLLDEQRTIATFSLAGGNCNEVAGNPNIAFDLIRRDEPWPKDPDDNLMYRSATLLAITSEFIRGLERSVGLRESIPGREPSEIRYHGPADPPWGPVHSSDLHRVSEIAEALSKSDISLGTHRDDSGNLTILIQMGDRAYGRPIPPASPLDSKENRGIAAEDAALTAASTWGLPDFVLNAKSINKGNSRREIGDGSIITGKKGLSIQVKSRDAAAQDPDRERRWLLKKAAEGARQANGTIRSLCGAPITLTNGRGREIPCDGSSINWIRVVILDHDRPPEGVTPQISSPGEPAIALLRRDWDFLFNQLRSVSAVVDYLHRAAADGECSLGEEPIRYYELADADEHATPNLPEPWVEQSGARHLSRPLLPKAPVSSEDTAGHAVFRIILEDLATGPFDREESERLHLLALLDRFSVSERATLGRLLLKHLENARNTPPGTTTWNTRRVIQDKGQLHLAFSVCNQFTDLHAEAFRQWAMIRHHEFTELDTTSTGSPLQTVAILLTPRYDGYRPWDTTMVTITGELDMTEEEIEGIRKYWNRGQQVSS